MDANALDSKLEPLWLSLPAQSLASAKARWQQREAWPARALADATTTLQVIAARLGLVGTLPPNESDLDEPPAAFFSQQQLRDTYRGFNRPTNIPRAEVATARVEFLAGDGLADPVLVQGGRGRFLDLCPGAAGCLAVAYAGTGEVVHAYPYYPDALEAANIVAAEAYPHVNMPSGAWGDNIRVTGIDAYPNGDLLVVFGIEGAFPHGAA